MMNFFLQNKPLAMVAEGGKTMGEHFGQLATGNRNISITHTTAPSGWQEPHQYLQFDQWLLVNSGRKLVEVDGQVMVVEAGQSILLKQGARVRLSNPFAEACDYWCIYLPAGAAAAELGEAV